MTDETLAHTENVEKVCPHDARLPKDKRIGYYVRFALRNRGDSLVEEPALVPKGGSLLTFITTSFPTPFEDPAPMLS